MIKKFLFVCIIFFTTSSFSQIQKPEPVPLAMINFLLEIKSLQPYMVSPSEFSNSKNEKFIQTHLDKLSEVSTELKHLPRLDKPFFRVMTEILPEHLQELQNSFREGHKDYARSMLLSTLDGCSSCHSQMSSKFAKLWHFETADLQGTKFDKAEFLFAIRQYDDALALYRDVVSDFRPTTAEPISSDVLESLKKKQSIFIRVKNDLPSAKSEIDHDSNNKNLPEPVMMSLVDSSFTIKQLIRMKKPDVLKSSSRDMEEFAARTLNKAVGIGWLQKNNTVAQMYVESVLYDFVQNNSAEHIGPGIYYWLAKCEKKTSTNFYFPIAEFYLKECIDRYPLSYEAKLCFNELESLGVQNNTAYVR